MTTTTAAPAYLSPHTLDNLRRVVTGPVLVPGDDAFAGEISPWVTSTVHRPDVVVGSTCADDVVAAVRYALHHDLSVSVQATGHGAATPIDGGVLITTSRMTNVCIDPQRRTARVGAGTKWAAVIAAAAPYGLAPLSGSTSDVGVVGYSLGGGLGPLGRLYGFAADQIRSAEIVTGDGRLRTVSADDDSGLFWGLRGGKGNFGVVTSLEVGLVPVERLYGGAMFFDGADSSAVLHAWREWVDTVPEELTSSIALLRLPDLEHVPAPLRGRLTVHLRVAYVGDAAEGERLVAPMRAAARPIVDLVRDMPFTECDSIHMDPVDPTAAFEGARLLSSLPHEAIDVILDQAGPGANVPLIFAELRHMGGALSRQPDVPSAVAGRDAPFSFMALGPLAPGLEDVVPVIVQGVVDALAPWHATSRLINFIGHDVDPQTVASAYPPDVARRLHELKDRFDPHGLFRHGAALASRTAIPHQTRTTN